MALGRVVGACRECGAREVREAYVAIVALTRTSGESFNQYRHTAMRRKLVNNRPVDRPCNGAVIPCEEYLAPPPQQFSLEKWKNDRANNADKE